MPPLACALALLVASAPTGAPAAVPPLRFGLYPGGSVGGTVETHHAPAVTRHRVRSAIRRLRGSRRSFVLRAYVSYSGSPRMRVATRDLRRTLADARATGCQVEVVVRYRPSVLGAGPAGFADAVRRVIEAHGRDRRLVGVQVTNEPDVLGAPGAADGAYPGVREALASGLAAAQAARAAIGRPRLRIGFNVAHASHGTNDPSFWQVVAALPRPIDFVGIDVYPGTWPPPARPPSRADAYRQVFEAVAQLRTMASASGIDPRTPIQISENGYPTGPGRPRSAQERVLRASVAAARDARRRYGVRDFRYFDLYDAGTGSGRMEDGYGLLDSRLRPKPAFATFRRLVAAR
ncbi:hypothetical protein [Patulibacter defluvii]|uniref:hypothetical protein n=2 Tax=Bacteria TaxID=2 RepID=UPI002A7638DD|nr:hypothetical protein [Patulibacter sp. DM4]